jgi:metal-responsive CopG/Arc/MetJ family transcriptional regulator
MKYVERTINVPDDLLARIESTVAQQGKSVDQWIEEALLAQLEDRAWHDLLAYGREKGLASGYREEDVPRAVKEWRREHRAR